MKFSNRKKIGVYKNTYLFLFLSGIVLSLLNNFNQQNMFLQSIFLGVITISLFYWYGKARYFEYDSTGLGLVVISKGILLSEYNNYRELRIEIPKEKLIRFEIKNRLISKKLYLYIKSGQNLKKTSVDVTLLEAKQLKKLKYSLTKVVSKTSNNK